MVMAAIDDGLTASPSPRSAAAARSGASTAKAARVSTFNIHLQYLVECHVTEGIEVGVRIVADEPRRISKSQAI